ncbi:MAG: hypothetical protein ACKV2Q_23320 [Planctomycetaceae bacterium]
MLEVLDEVTRPLVVEATFDEIFVGQQPILMGVEPNSFCWTKQSRSKRRGVRCAPRWSGSRPCPTRSLSWQQAISFV